MSSRWLPVWYDSRERFWYPNESSTETSESVLNIGSSYIPESIDPVNHGGGPLGRIGVYEALCRVFPNLDIKPQLASDWTVSEDNLTWTFTFRDNAQFHDGTKLTGDARQTSLHEKRSTTRYRRSSTTTLHWIC